MPSGTPCGRPGWAAAVDKANSCRAATRGAFGIPRTAPTKTLASLSLSLVFALLLLVGCTVGPRYQRPSVSIPTEHRGQVTPAAAASLADQAWWEVFHDAVLQDLGYALHSSFDRSTVLAALGHDKKRAAGRQRWILPMEVGRVIEVDDVTDTELDLALSAIAA